MKKQRFTKSKGILSLLFSIVLAITGCSNEESIPQTEQGTRLNISVGIKQPEARGVIKGSTLPDGSKIGVRLAGAGDATDYQSYEHVCYTASGTGDAQTWSTVNDIVLNETSGTLYAYYPYTEDIDMTAIPVDMTAADQTDWMYATPITGVNETNPNVEIEQNHALANISITLDKGSYAGEGNVSSIRVQSQGFATGGTFNAAQDTPAFTAFTGTGDAITRTLTDVKLGGEATEMMVIPTGEESEVNIYVTVDGEEYVSTTSTKELKAGKIYDYTLQFSSTGMKVVKVTVKDWELDVQETIPAVKVDTESAEYADYVKLTYNVVDISEPTELFGQELDLNDVEKMALVDDNGINQVTPVKSYHFENNGLKTIYIKFKDVKSIPDYAFYECTELTGKVVIPESVTTIGTSAFEYCKGLKDFNIPNSVTEIEARAFWYCEGLTEINIPNSVTSIGNLAFDGCSGLTNIVIPKSVTSIGIGVFARCEGLASIIVDEGNAFYDSRNNCNAIMETVTNTLLSGCKNTVIPQDCQAIEKCAFEGCSGLTGTLTIPNSVTRIGHGAFWGCSGLTGELTIPNSVTKIAGYAFHGCWGLTGTLTIPNSVTEIEYGAFIGCGVFTEIIVDNGNTVYDSRNNCNAIMETATNTLIQGCMNTIIPQDCQNIGDSAFEYCWGLTEITIPKSVTSIGNWAFKDCQGLTSITLLATTAPTIGSDNFVNFYSGGKLYVPIGSTGYDTWMSTEEGYLGYWNWTKIEQ